MSDHAKADYLLLSLANEKGKFALQLGVHQEALERGIYNRWFTLVDVSPITERPGLFRIFLLTDAGFERLAELRKRYAH